MPDSSISDHIGRIGENCFQDLADRARLIIGQIVPDRLGRDRILEFEFEAKSSQSYDRRPPPIGCSVQIKSILKKNRTILLSLSVAERLAADTRPVFICIFRVGPSDEIVDMYLLHLLDDNLARILKRLRVEYKKGTKDLNKKEISFAISNGLKVSTEPKALKNAIRTFIGADMQDYAQRKIRQRNTAGFISERRLSGAISFSPATPEDFLDGMLGLKKLSINSIKMFEERFDIKLPVDFPHLGTFQGAEIQFAPEPVDTAVLYFERIEPGDSAEFHCEIVVPAASGIPFDEFRILARTALFDVVLGKSLFKLQNCKHTYDEEMPCRSWLEFLRFMQIVSTPAFSIELKLKGNQTLFRGKAELPSGETKSFKPEIDLLEKFIQLRTKAKAGDTPVSLQNLIGARHNIRTFHASIFEPLKLGKCSFKFTGTKLSSENQMPVIVLSTLVVGDEQYALGLRCEMDVQSEGSEHSFSSTSTRALKITRLDNTDGSLAEFGNQLCEISGVQMLVVPDSTKLKSEKPLSSPRASPSASAPPLRANCPIAHRTAVPLPDTKNHPLLLQRMIINP